MTQTNTDCNICGGTSTLLGVIPFDRNNSNIDIIDNTPIEYYRCDSCGSINCPEMQQWEPYKLAEKVYNDAYINYDPDYVNTRPSNYAKWFADNVVKQYSNKISHLDYGSGSGVMSCILKEDHGWNSSAYDPYYNSVVPTEKFDFITAIEVVEHSTNIEKTIQDMLKYLKPNGIIMFSTQFAKPEYDISWWYIGARNGHISIVSREGMKHIARNNKLYLSSYGEGMHMLAFNRTRHRDMLGFIDGSR